MGAEGKPGAQHVAPPGRHLSARGTGSGPACRVSTTGNVQCRENVRQKAGRRHNRPNIEHNSQASVLPPRLNLGLSRGPKNVELQAPLQANAAFESESQVKPPRSPQIWPLVPFRNRPTSRLPLKRGCAVGRLAMVGDLLVRVGQLDQSSLVVRSS